MAWQDHDWVHVVGVSLKIAVVVSFVYVGGVFLERRWAKWEGAEQPRTIELHEDLYVHPKRSYISSFETARKKLVGAPLWVKEGWRWVCEPGERLLEPIEKITPTRVFERGSQVWIAFERADGACEMAIASAGRFWVDDMFFIEEPRELFSHWPAEAWEKIEAHQVEPGMSEYQAAFALGVGIVREASNNGRFRVVEYSACKQAGLTPVVVRYVDGAAESVTPL